MKTAKERIFWGAILVFCLCGLYLFLSLNGLSYRRALSSTPLASITVVPGTTIITPDYSLLSLATPTITTEASAQIGDTIKIGSYIQISGTGGSGLNIRINPQLSAEKNFIGNESEVFKVIDGPVTQDNYTWWNLVAPYDESRQGWAVEDYLTLINP